MLSKLLSKGGIFALFLLFINSPSYAEEDVLVRKTDKLKGRVIFTYTVKDNSDIYSINFENMQVRKLISSRGEDSFPRWSPDGSEFVYQSNTSGNREIYKANWDGTNVRRLTKSPGTDGEADWSPDGDKIVFISTRNGSGTNIYSMNPNGSDVKALTDTSSKHVYPRWSPRGNEILITANIEWPGWDLVLLDIETNKLNTISKGFNSFTRGNWNHDGSKIVFSYGAGENVNIFQINKGDSVAKPLAKRAGKNYDAIWLDDNKNILFVGELHPGSGNYQIYMLDSETGNVDQLTDGPGSIRHLSWTRFPELKN